MLGSRFLPEYGIKWINIKNFKDIERREKGTWKDGKIEERKQGEGWIQRQEKMIGMKNERIEEIKKERKKQRKR